MPIIMMIFLLPLAELWLFFAVADWIGTGRALLLLLLSTMVGGWLVWSQGLETLRTLQFGMTGGSLDLGDRACLAGAGILLFLPGFLTDMAAVTLLIPPFRRWVRLSAGKQASPQRRGYDTSSQSYGYEEIIEGDFERVDQPDRRPPE